MTLLDDRARVSPGPGVSRDPDPDADPTPQGRRPHPPRGSWLLALVLTCAALMAVDRIGGDHSPVEPVRSVVAEVLAPAQTVAADVTRPITSIPDWFTTQGQLRRQVDELQAANDELTGRLRTDDYRANRLAALEGLATQASNIGYGVVPARVVGIGPAQSFDQTVLIDAGTDAGVRPDMTVIASDGLVGRVTKVTASTATVLLVVDADSTVGGRIGRTMALGFTRGSGSYDSDAALNLELVDTTSTPARGDAVVSWGSDRGAPYVAGVPIGEVTGVFRDLRDSSQRVEVRPYVDFGSLDVVGVVVPDQTVSDRGVIEADGSWR